MPAGRPSPPRPSTGAEEQGTVEQARATESAQGEARAARVVVVGRVAGVLGVQGWVRIESFTDPPENLLDYDCLLLRTGDEWQPVRRIAGRRHGQGLAFKLEAVDDRDAARQLVGAEIAVRRSDLPATAPGEYYWADLVGLRVVNRDGTALGVVGHLLATGANDVLVVQGDRERLIPFVEPTFVTNVDLRGGVIQVDWDAEF